MYSVHRSVYPVYTLIDTGIGLGIDSLYVIQAHVRDRSFFMGGGGALQIGGHKFHCKQFEGGGAKFQCKPLEGWQNFNAQTFEGHPEATKNTFKMYSIIQLSCFMPTFHFKHLPLYDAWLQ